jgi:two-component system chemotaxis sensor kinase CheA
VLEDALERLQNGQLSITPALVTVLLEAVDELRNLVASAAAGDEEPSPVTLRLSAFLVKQPDERALAARSTEPTLPPLPAHSLRVDVDKLDRMMGLLGELTVARGRMGTLLERRGEASWQELADAHRDSDRLVMDLQEQIMKVRMVSVWPSFRRHARTVRDLALSFGKQARLVAEGDDVEIDLAAIERIRDPLVHMIRNAIDHGLEQPEVRARLGKDPVGTIRLKARYDAGRVLIELSDDGGGLDRARLRERARQTRPSHVVDAMSDQALCQLIFEAGFSTAETVTELSGRGVGMDVVRRAVESLRGTISIDSREGEGTTLTLTLPLTLAIIEGFSVRLADQVYVLPLESVTECLELPPAHRAQARAEGVLSLRGEPLPYLSLREHFGLGGVAAARESVVVVRHGSGLAGLAVDALLGEGQAVIKPLPRGLQGVRGVSGASVLGNGRVALILDVPALLSTVAAPRDAESSVVSP